MELIEVKVSAELGLRLSSRLVNVRIGVEVRIRVNRVGGSG